jgi:hypothetical protein
MRPAPVPTIAEGEAEAEEEGQDGPEEAGHATSRRPVLIIQLA